MPDPKSAKKRRSYWLKQLHQWHWISSAICLVGMIVFAVTGITLNHAAEIEGRPQVTTRDGRVPDALAASLRTAPASRKAIVPDALAAWTRSALSIDIAGREAEWQEGEIYVSLPRPGGDAWLTIDRKDGAVMYERTDRGWISYLNDLHKGRNTGLAWRWFIDVFAAACLVFCLTGLVLLQLHSHNRPTTWPIVGLGLLVPVLLLVVFLH